MLHPSNPSGPPPPLGYLPPSGISRDAQKKIRWLLWAYFYLLIFEGVLRKWVVPSLSGPLLLVRDPVAIAIIATAVLNGLKLPRWFMLGYLGVLIIYCMLGMAQIVSGTGNLKVLLFGLRTDFLHVPLIPIMAAVLDLEDVKRFGRHLLYMALPMALLMVMQFRSSPDAFINRTAGAGEGVQIMSAMGHIRTPGTFSFISGPIYFFAWVLAVVIGNSLLQIRSENKLTQVALCALLIASAVSGSRSLIAALLYVIAALVFGLMIKPQSIVGLYRLILLGAVASAIILPLGTFREGLEVMNTRFDEGAGSEGIGKNAMDRTAGGFLDPFYLVSDVPFLGYGVGMGTNAGAVLLTGDVGFLLAENELARDMMEAGPFAGFLFIGFRLALALWLLRECIFASKRGNLIPMLLWGAAGMNVFSGPWGQATSLGFAVFGGGLCLAATRVRPIQAAWVRPTFRPAVARS